MSEIVDPYKNLSGKFIMCQECGKPIIERLPNGLWRFKFGRQRMMDESGRTVRQDGKVVFQNTESPVFIYIHGSILIKCFRIKCNAWNNFNYLPVNEDFETIVNKKAHI